MADPKVQVRMYRQGLGDCFLLRFETSQNRYFHVLIDCGVFLGTKDAQQKMRDVARNILETLKGQQLDLLIATHEHYDHLAGFVLAQDLFDRISVKQTWLAWTEDPNNLLAKQLRADRAVQVAAVRAAASAATTASNETGISPAHQSRARELATRLEGIAAFFGAADKGNSTEAAMKYVACKAPVRYCNPGETIRIPELGNVRFYVLGPPQDKKALMRTGTARSDIYGMTEVGFGEGAQRGASLLGALEINGGGDGVSRPFDYWHELTPLQDASMPLPHNLPDVIRNYLSTESWRRIDSDWLGSAEELALALDSAKNNTSLALAIELEDSGNVLLFPGDAQVGNWESWSALKFDVSASSGNARSVTLSDLLERTVLYKVGHHASHNATLREGGLEKMTHAKLIALIPVDQDFANNTKHWAMPADELYKRLQQKTCGRVLRADREWPRQTDARPASMSSVQWSEFLDCVTLPDNKLYIETRV